MMRNATILLLLAALLCPVISPAMGKNKRKRIMDSWLQQSKQQLILKEGPPDRVTSDGGKGEIVIYAKRVYVPSYNMGSGIYTPPQDYYEYSMFYVNADGIIYAWRWERNPNPPQRFDVNVRADVYEH